MKKFKKFYFDDGDYDFLLKMNFLIISLSSWWIGDGIKNGRDNTENGNNRMRNYIMHVCILCIPSLHAFEFLTKVHITTRVLTYRRGIMTLGANGAIVRDAVFCGNVTQKARGRTRERERRRMSKASREKTNVKLESREPREHESSQVFSRNGTN